jgi:hypothetical protein
MGPQHAQGATGGIELKGQMIRIERATVASDQHTERMVGHDAVQSRWVTHAKVLGCVHG